MPGPESPPPLPPTAGKASALGRGNPGEQRAHVSQGAEDVVHEALAVGVCGGPLAGDAGKPPPAIPAMRRSEATKHPAGKDACSLWKALARWAAVRLTPSL